MPKYHVHIYREMRLYYPDIDAENPKEAANIAAAKATRDAATIEDCDGRTFAALIDVDGDPDHALSGIIDFETAPSKESAPCN